MRSTAAIVLAVCSGVGVVAWAPAQPAAPAKATSPASPEGQLAESLRVLIGGRDATSQSSVLRALRSLHDPRLTPLFASLAAGTSPLHRMHGIFGMAELPGSKGIDLLLVRRIDRAPERASILLSALDEGLVTPDQAEDIARWPDLEPPVLLAVCTYLRDKGRPIPDTRARELSLKPETAPAAYGALILTLSPAAQRDGLSVLERRTHDLLEPESKSIVLALLADCRRGMLSGGHDLAAAVLSRVRDDHLLRDEAARLLLLLRPGDPLCVQQLQAGLQAGSDLGQRLRVALTILEAAAHHAAPRTVGGDTASATPALRVPEALLARLAEDPDPLIIAIGKAASALTRAPDSAGSALAALASQGHTASIRRLLDQADNLPRKPRAEFLIAAILQGNGTDSAERRDTMFAAAEGLAKRDVEALAGLIRSAVESKQTGVLSALLLAAARIGNDETAAAVATVPGDAWPDASTGDVATLVVMGASVRREEQVPAQTIERLNRMAAGGGGLASAWRAQAAWLTLRAQKLDRPALAHLLSKPLP